MTDSPAEDPDHDEDLRVRFKSAWRHLSDAQATCKELAETWNDACPDAFYAHVYVGPAGDGEIWVELDFGDSIRQRLNELARKVGSDLRQALDAALVATAHLVSGVIVEPDPDLVRFPMAETIEAFLAAYSEGALDGIRPDHVEFIQAFQPFMHNGDAHPVQFIRQLSEQSPDEDAIVAWCHLAQPEVTVAEPWSIEELVTDPDGPTNLSRRVATFTVRHPESNTTADRPTVYGNPNSAFDLMSAVGPEPADGDDTFGHRAAAAVRVVRQVLAGFERSFGLREGSSVKAWDPTKRLARQGEDTRPAFGEMAGLDQRGGEARTAIGDSDIGIVTVNDGKELILAVAAEDSIYLRRVTAATALDPRLPKGRAAEEAVASAASLRGLPDFVFPPAKRQTGSGVRELGDGIVFLTGMGLILQVKSRESATDRTERESHWIVKQVAAAARQAAGTLRQLRREPAELTNQRGRQVTVDGNRAKWVGVILIDHPDPPEGITPITDCAGLPVIVLLRRDWEFLFEQLGSTAAVVNYVHRVAGDPLELGDEPVRYYELAGKDATADPEPPRNSWGQQSGSERQSRPILPQQPTSLGGSGYAMFRMLLEDLANARTDREEQRLAQLTLLDNTPVVYQAEIGSRLLDRLLHVKHVRVDSSSWDFRWLQDTQRPQQLCFGVCNQYSNMHREIFRSRLALQHHRMIAHEWDPTDEPATTGVLLTPNYRLAERLWDTTTLTILGNTALSPEEVSAYEEGWRSPYPA